MSRPGFGDYFFMEVSFLIYSFVSVFSKTAALQGLFTPKFFLFAVIELGVLIVYALLWQQVLKKFSLIKAYSNKGIVVIWSLLWAFLIFDEAITASNIAGCALILAGIILVSTDER